MITSINLFKTLFCVVFFLIFEEKNAYGGIHFSTYFGGNDEDKGYGICLNPIGEVLFAGSSTSNDFPVSSGAFSDSLNGSFDVFVSELDSSGQNLIFSTFLGGDDFDEGFSLSLNQNSIFLTGYTTSTNFPTTQNSFSAISEGGFETFVTKLSTNGNSLEFSTFLGGGFNEWSNQIFADSLGFVFLTGQTNSADFPITSGSIDTSFGGNLDVFLAKLDSSGALLNFSTFLGGNSSEIPYGLFVKNSICLTGFTSSSNFPTNVNAFDTTFNGSSFDLDAFATKLNFDGDSLIFSTYLGGNDQEIAFEILEDESGFVYITGSTLSQNFPLKNAFDSTLNATSNSFGSDAFLMKLTPDGSSLLFSTFFGTDSAEVGKDLEISEKNVILVSGETNVEVFASQKNLSQIFHGNKDIFVAEFDLSASQIYSYQIFGGNNAEFHNLGNPTSFGKNETVFLVGTTESLDFPTTSNVFGESFFGGHSDVFVTKFCFDTFTQVGEPEKTPTGFYLSKNYPNPFNPTTRIDYDFRAASLNLQGQVKLVIFNILGKEVKQIPFTQNRGRIFWDGTDEAGNLVSSGIYFYKTNVGQSLGKMIFLK